MSDKVPNPVSGNPASKGAPDGVSGVPGGDDQREVHGRSAGGESAGGAYPNPHTGKEPSGGGFMGHGGQTDIAYHGSGQGGDDGASNWRPARWLVPPLGPEGGGFTRVKTCSSTRAGGGGITAGRCCRPEAGRPAAAAVERNVVTASSNSSSNPAMAGVVLPPLTMVRLTCPY